MYSCVQLCTIMYSCVQRSMYTSLLILLNELYNSSSLLAENNRDVYSCVQLCTVKLCTVVYNYVQLCTAFDVHFTAHDTQRTVQLFQLTGWKPQRHVQLCTVVYSCVQLCTVVYSCVQLYTVVYSCVQLCTVVYSCVQLCTVVYSCVQLCTVVYSCVDSCVQHLMYTSLLILLRELYNSSNFLAENNRDVYSCEQLCTVVYSCVQLCTVVYSIRCTLRCSSYSENCTTLPTFWLKTTETCTVVYSCVQLCTVMYSCVQLCTAFDVHFAAHLTQRTIQLFQLSGWKQQRRVQLCTVVYSCVQLCTVVYSIQCT